MKRKYRGRFLHVKRDFLLTLKAPNLTTNLEVLIFDSQREDELLSNFQVVVSQTLR